MNDTACTPDANGVYHAYVGGKGDVLKVSSSATGSVSYQVTRMDTSGEINANSDGAYPIPDFEGSLMFKIDGIQDIVGSTAKDTTSVFLLVSVDKTAPVLTLSAPIFYADPDSGKYTITGTADAGSQIFYNDDDGPTSVDAADNGSFAISGTLEESTNTAVLSLYAKDSAANASAPQAALITKQKQQSGSSSGGGSSYSDYTIQASANAHGSISPSGSVKVRADAEPLRLRRIAAISLRMSRSTARASVR